ncbi:hypothetical protein, partial [Neisseria meningitidis]|uniref:hypothetical protein n=1 Tax=Neisseria meningitidis TaxID=487 RepID=UPI00214CF631
PSPLRRRRQRCKRDRCVLAGAEKNTPAQTQPTWRARIRLEKTAERVQPKLPPTLRRDYYDARQNSGSALSV